MVKHEGWRCNALTPDELRPIFGRALYPGAAIGIEPLDETGEWWKKVEEDCQSYFEPGVTARGSLDAWKGLLAWFRTQSDFVELAFVSVDKAEEGMDGGCVFPRMLLGRTAAGSVAGLFGCVVYS